MTTGGEKSAELGMVVHEEMGSRGHMLFEIASDSDSAHSSLSAFLVHS